MLDKLFEGMTSPLNIQDRLSEKREAINDPYKKSELLLEALSYGAPEDRKTEIEIMKEKLNIERATHAFVETFALKTPKELTPEIIEMQKAVRDYMAAVAEGLKQYYDAAVQLKKW
jgi:hypothetical protein